MTGRTHGMMFRMRPPKNAPSNCKASDPLETGVLVCAGEGVDVADAVDSAIFKCTSAAGFLGALGNTPSSSDGQSALFFLTFLRMAGVAPGDGSVFPSTS